MAPVRRTLVAVWSGVGSSVVAKIEGKLNGISTGPSSSGASSVVVGSGSGTWARVGNSGLTRELWAETEGRVVGL